MLESNERLIRYYDLKLEEMPNDEYTKPAMSLKTFLGNMQSMNFQKEVENKSAVLRLADIKVDEENEIAVLLIHFSDTKKADPAFEELDSGNVRYEKKKTGEGIAVSMHMAVSYRTDHGRYLSLHETVPGLGVSRISSFLTSIFRKASPHTYLIPGRPTSRKAWVKAKFDGHASEELEDALKNGELRDVELIEQLNIDHIFDEPGSLKEHSKIIMLKPVKRLKGQACLDALTSLYAKARSNNVEKMRIHLKSDDAAPLNVPLIDVSKSEGLHASLVRTVAIEMENDMEQCEEKIREDMKDQLTDLILEARR